MSIIPDPAVDLFHAIFTQTLRLNGKRMTKSKAGQLVLLAFPDLLDAFADEHSFSMRLNAQHRSKYAGRFPELVRLRSRRAAV